MREELALPDDSALYLHIGRMVPQKNQLRLVDIFAEVLRTDPKAYLLLAGSGQNEYESEVLARIKSRGLDRRVRALGNRPDVSRLLEAADVMLFPSQWEGLPGVVLEACAVGVPVLASDLAVIREIQDLLPSLHSESLATTNQQWARKALALRNLFCIDRRKMASTAFLETPFQIRRCAQDQCRVWDGDPETSLTNSDSDVNAITVNRA